MTRTLDRRTVLQGVAAGTAATTGLAGCLGQADDSLESITVAYVPIFPNMQHYVMDQQGYYDELPVDVNVERFSSGPNVVTAFASGDIDVALFGITPAMVLADKGTEASILAANSRNGFKIMATDTVADRYDEAGAEAFEQFERDEGRRVRFGAPPDGSVPDVVLRHWIEDDLGAGETNSVISKSTVTPSNAVQTIQNGDIDATIIQEPFATIIAEADGFREIEWSGNILESHPVTVLFANQQVVDTPEIAESLVEQHTRATEFVDDSPDAAAADAASVIGSGVSDELARQALDSQASDFVSDPRSITEQAATMGEIVTGLGNIDAPVDESELFAFEPFDATQ